MGVNRFGSQISQQLPFMVVNKFNLMTTLGLALALAALSYAAMNPVANAVRQDLTVRGHDAVASQAGQDTTGQGGTNYQGSGNGGQKVDGDNNQGNDNKQELLKKGADGTNGRDGNGAVGTSNFGGQNGNGADGSSGQNGLQGSTTRGSNGYDGNLGEDFNIEVD